MVTHTASRMLWPRAILTFNMVGRACFPHPRGQVFFPCFFSLLALGFGEWGFSI